MPLCLVSYVDMDGVRHAVEVEAGSMYEAAALAITKFKKHDPQAWPRLGLMLSLPE